MDDVQGTNQNIKITGERYRGVSTSIRTFFGQHFSLAFLSERLSCIGREAAAIVMNVIMSHKYEFILCYEFLFEADICK